MPLAAVAMSGGVDSSTAAALLVEQGYDVVGLAMRLYDASGTLASAGGRCCGPRDLEDARRVAARLGIAFYVLDYVERFRTAVIDDFVSEYTQGRTPNPCVRCNERVKFGPLMRRARALGAEFLATGHYARIDHTSMRGAVAGAGARPALLRAADADKDQSYFLFALDEEALAYLRFPVGALSKTEVRAAARRAGLCVADKPESMEICFVPDGDHATFVARRAGAAAPSAGDVVDLAGRVVGRHAGVHRFTVGQRRGLGDVATPGDRRTVVRIDAASARVVVGARADATRGALRVRDVRWIGARPERAIDALVQVRHRARPAPARVAATGGEADVVFGAADVLAAPGQAAVFYDGDRVLGGGWIR
ncbi:MAG: tRNA 2-thiouridine(34) synthase MnmA [Myxococcota bacterium]